MRAGAGGGAVPHYAFVIARRAQHAVAIQPFDPARGTELAEVLELTMSAKRAFGEAHAVDLQQTSGLLAKTVGRQF